MFWRSAYAGTPFTCESRVSNLPSRNRNLITRACSAVFSAVAAWGGSYSYFLQVWSSPSIFSCACFCSVERLQESLSRRQAEHTWLRAQGKAARRKAQYAKVLSLKASWKSAGPCEMECEQQGVVPGLTGAQIIHKIRQYTKKVGRRQLCSKRAAITCLPAGSPVERRRPCSFPGRKSDIRSAVRSEASAQRPKEAPHISRIRSRW